MAGGGIEPPPEKEPGGEGRDAEQADERRDAPQPLQRLGGDAQPVSQEPQRQGGGEGDAPEEREVAAGLAALDRDDVATSAGHHGERRRHAVDRHGCAAQEPERSRLGPHGGQDQEERRRPHDTQGQEERRRRRDGPRGQVAQDGEDDDRGPFSGEQPAVRRVAWCREGDDGEKREGDEKGADDEHAAARLGELPAVLRVESRAEEHRGGRRRQEELQERVAADLAPEADDQGDGAEDDEHAADELAPADVLLLHERRQHLPEAPTRRTRGRARLGGRGSRWRLPRPGERRGNLGRRRFPRYGERRRRLGRRRHRERWGLGGRRVLGPRHDRGLETERVEDLHPSHLDAPMDLLVGLPVDKAVLPQPAETARGRVELVEGPAERLPGRRGRRRPGRRRATRRSAGEDAEEPGQEEPDRVPHHRDDGQNDQEDEKDDEQFPHGVSCGAVIADSTPER